MFTSQQWLKRVSVLESNRPQLSCGLKRASKSSQQLIVRMCQAVGGCLQVRDLERRQEKEHAREEAKVAKQLQREASERERQTQVMAQEAAAQLQLQVCLAMRFE